MDTGNLLHGAGVGDVDAQVSDLAVEVGRVDIVLLVKTIDPDPAARVLVGGQDPQPDKVAGSLDRWPVVCIVDHLGAKGQSQSRRNQVFARREVNYGVLGGETVAGLAAALAVLERLDDGLGVVGRAIALGAIVLDISEDLCGSSASVEFPQSKCYWFLWGVMIQKQRHFFFLVLAPE